MASSSNQLPEALSKPIQVDDTGLAEPHKRVAEPSVESASKKPRPQDESMEVSYTERMMQEDFAWCLHNVSDMCENDSTAVQQALADMTYLDENTGELLDPRLVQAGEAEELQRFAKMGVYGYADRQAAYDDPDGVFVNVKWVRTNKGTKQKPQVKCRLVAQELAYGTRMDELYANTPSSSCVKMALLLAA